MTHNDRLVINTLCNPVSTDAQCMHYGDTAALHKYSALVRPRPDHNGRSIQFCHYPWNTGVYSQNPWIWILTVAETTLHSLLAHAFVLLNHYAVIYLYKNIYLLSLFSNFSNFDIWYNLLIITQNLVILNFSRKQYG